MLQGPRAFYDVSSILVTGINEALLESPAGQPERACVVPGDIAWDGCDCGQLAISPQFWSVTDTFPEANQFGGSGSLGTPCNMPWLVATIEIQIVRCAPSPDGNTFEVSCAALDVAAEILIADAYITVTRAIEELCALKENDDIVDYLVTDQRTVGPGGGCVGTGLAVQVAVDR